MDQKAFFDLVASWHDFNIAISAAAATLLGLLFVGLTINFEKIIVNSQEDLRAVAEETYLSFFYVIGLAVTVLIPQIDVHALYLILLGVGVSGLANIFVQAFRAIRARNRAWRLIPLLRRFLLPILAFTLVIVAAFNVNSSSEGTVIIGFNGLAGSVLLLLASGTRSAWYLLVRVNLSNQRKIAEPEKHQPPAPTHESPTSTQPTKKKEEKRPKKSS